MSKIKIFESVEQLRQYSELKGFDIVATSGGFDPMHIGHLRCIQETSRIALSEWKRNLKTVVIVNGDGFLMRKKGYSFMPLHERMEIIAGIEGVDFVVPWDDGTQTVVGAIEKLQPVIFTKGGDRDSAQNVPEFDLCEQINCNVIFGVGGNIKVQSSSKLVNTLNEMKRKE